MKIFVEIDGNLQEVNEESLKEFFRIQEYARDKDLVLTDTAIYCCMALARNKKIHGVPSCPCRPVKKGEVVNPAIVCPCDFLFDDLAKYGHCHCRLFFKKFTF
jgi:ferredoxin-thioredoxin reductase catalytic subunit